MRKILVYILAYIVMLCAGFGGVYIFTDRSSPANADISSEPSILDKMVTNLTNANAISANVEVGVWDDTEKIANVKISVDIDMIDGFNDFAIKGRVNIANSELDENIDFWFMQNEVYLSALNANLLVQTSDLNQLIGLVSAVIAKFVPNFDMSSMLDMQKLMDLMNGMETVENESGATLKMTTPIGNIVIALDTEFNIKDIKVPNLLYKTYLLTPKVSLTTAKENLGLTAPENKEEYVNLSEEIDFITIVIDSLNRDFKVNTNYNNVNVYAVKNGNNISASAEFNDNLLNLTLYNNVVYLEFGQMRLKAGKNDFDALNELVKKYLNQSPILENINVTDIVASKLSQIDIKNLDLSKMTDYIYKDENNAFHFKVDGTDIVFEIEENLVKNIRVLVNGQMLELEFIYENVDEIVEPQGEYLSAKSALNAIDCAVQTIMSDEVNMNIVATIDDVEISMPCKYAYNNGNIYFEALINVYDLSLSLYLIDSIVYVEYQGIKLKCDENTLNEIIALLPNNQTDKVELSAIVGYALNIMKNISLSATNNGLNILVKDNIINVATSEGRLARVVAEICGVRLVCDFSYLTFTKKVINQDEFVKAENFVELVKNTLDLVKNGVSGTINFEYEGVSVVGNINFVDSIISAQATITYQEKTINIKLIDNIVYAEFMGAKVKFALNDIEQVLAFVEKLNIEMPQGVNIDKGQILGIITQCYVSYTGDSINLTYKDVNVDINTTDDKLSEVNVDLNGTRFSVVLSEVVENITLNNADEYLDLITLIPLIESAYNTIQSSSFSGSATISASVNNQLLTLPLDYKVKLLENGVSAYLKTTINEVNVEIYYNNNNVYIIVEGISIKANINELDEVIAYIQQKANINSQTNIEVSAVVGQLLNILSVNDLSFVNTIIAQQNELSMNIGNLNVNLEFVDAIEFVRLSLNELTVKGVTISNIVVETTLSTSEVSISVPSNEYVDINDLLKIVESAENTYKAQALSGTIEVTIPQNVVSMLSEDLTLVCDFNYSYNGGNYKLNIETTILNDKLAIVLENNTIYLSYQGINVYAPISDLMAKLPNGEGDKNAVVGVVENIVKALGMSYSDNTLNISYLTNSVSIAHNGDIINNIIVNSDYVNANITLNRAETYVDPELNSDYVYVNNLVELVTNIMDIVSGNKVYAEFNLNVNGMDIAGLVNYENGNISVQANMTLLGKSVEIRLLNEVIYVNFDGLKIKFAINDIAKITALLNEYGLIDNANKMQVKVDKDSIIEMLNTLYLTYNGESISATIDYDLAKFGIDLSKINLSMLGLNLSNLQANTLNVNVNTMNNSLNGANVNVGDIALNVNLVKLPCEINESVNGYIDVIKFAPFIKPFISAYLSKQISGQIVINVPQIEKYCGEIVVNYKATFGENMRISLKTNILGLPVSADVVANNAYIQIDGMKYVVNLNNINEVKAFIQNLPIDLPSFDIKNLLASINFENLIIDIMNEKELQVGYGDLNVIITNVDNINIAVDYKGMTAQISVKETQNTFENTFENYLPISDLLNKAQSIVDIINAGSVRVDSSLTFKGYTAKVDADIDFAKVLKTKQLADLKVNAKVSAFGKNIDLKLLSNVVYISVDGLNMKLAISDINQVMNLLKNHEINLGGDIKFDIKTLINSLTANENSIIVTLDKLGEVDINFVENVISNINLTKQNIVLNINSTNEKIDIILQENYSNVVDLIPLADKIWNIYESKLISLDASLNIDLLGHTQTINAGVNVDFSKKLNVDMQFELEGINIAMHLRGETIYLDIDGMKVKLVENDIYNLVAFLNENFKLNLIAPSVIENAKAGQILLDFVNKNFAKKTIDTSNFDLGKLGKWTKVDDALTITLRDGSVITLNTQRILNANCVFAEFGLIADVTAIGEGVVLSKIDVTQYTSLQEIIDMANMLIDTILTKQYNFLADAKVYNAGELRFDAQVDARLSLINGMFFSGRASLTGEKNIGVEVDYDNEYLYCNYEGLKLKIHKNNIKEIAGILLSVIGIDISSIPGFDNLDLDFKLDNIQSILPNIDFGNPLTMLRMIESLDYANGAITIGLDGAYIFGGENAKTMTLVIKTKDGKLDSIDLNNIYTSKTEYFDLHIALSDYTGVEEIGEGYIDISSSSTLIKSVINTSELTDYHITGNANVNISLLKEPWTIPYDIKIKLVDKKPVVVAKVGAIPVVAPVNNDAPYKFGDTVSGLYCGLNRMLNVYYLDGFVYMHRTEEIPVFASSNRVYEKKLKVALSSILTDPMYYLQYAIGLSDDIISAINESIQKSKNRTSPINLGNVLLDYNHNDAYYNATLNMKEISNDDKMGNMTLGIKTSYIDSANKDYTTDLKFNMNMPFTSSIQMDLATPDMKLVDIGSELDMSDVYSYVSNYSYAENVEMEYNDGKWSKASERTYTLSFEGNGGVEVSDIVAVVDAPIVLPTYGERIVDEGNVRYTYSFGGWFTTENFKDGTQFTQTTMPRGDKTLYAKWNLIKTEFTHTITFNSQGGTAVANQNYLPNASVDLSGVNPTKKLTFVKGSYKAGKGYLYTITRYTFAGWYTDSACITAFNGVMPNADITLYAKWTSVTTEEYRFAVQGDPTE